MAEMVKAFLGMVEEIFREKPAYRQPGSARDGTCDCIGLIIGALYRMGIKWNGIHGSNYAARKATVALAKISGLEQLMPGHIVYKAYEPGEGKYNLPGRYKKGGAYHNGDLRDYYHVGVVTSVNPVVITHMTSPTAKKQTVKKMSDLGKWGYFGQCRPLHDAGGVVVSVGGSAPATADMKDKQKDAKDAVKTASEGAVARVYAENGLPVKMRKEPSQKCREWQNLACGTEVILEAPGETWARISYGKKKGWYMMAKYLDVA